MQQDSVDVTPAIAVPCDPPSQQVLIISYLTDGRLVSGGCPGKKSGAELEN